MIFLNSISYICQSYSMFKQSSFVVTGNTFFVTLILLAYAFITNIDITPRLYFIFILILLSFSSHSSDALIALSRILPSITAISYPSLIIPDGIVISVSVFILLFWASLFYYLKLHQVLCFLYQFSAHFHVQYLPAFAYIVLICHSFYHQASVP